MVREDVGGEGVGVGVEEVFVGGVVGVGVNWFEFDCWEGSGEVE